jgi:hypothetical protein
MGDISRHKRMIFDLSSSSVIANANDNDNIYYAT